MGERGLTAALLRDAVSAASDAGALLAVFWVDCAAGHDDVKATGTINRA